MRHIYIFFICLIILSCKRTEEKLIEIINVNPLRTDSTGLSEIASGIKKIMLETNDSCLITGIQEIEQSANYIFINDGGKRVLQFDIAGKFIRQIGNEGRGPGEYMSILNLAVDSGNNLIYVATIRKILCYEFSGRFLNEIKQENLSEFIIVAGNSLWSVSTKMGIKNNKNSYTNTTKLIRYTLEGSPLDTIIIRNLMLPELSGTIFQQAYYISDVGQTQYLYCPVLLRESIIRDTLYEVKGSNLIPFIKLDFGEAGEVIDGKKQIFIRNIYCTTNYLFTEYYFEKKNRFYCLDRIKKSAFNVSEGFTDNYYGTGIIQLRPLDLKKGIMFFVKEAYELTGKIEGVSESSNPVIFIVELKQN